MLTFLTVCKTFKRRELYLHIGENNSDCGKLKKTVNYKHNSIQLFKNYIYLNVLVVSCMIKNSNYKKSNFYKTRMSNLVASIVKKTKKN